MIALEGRDLVGTELKGRGQSTHFLYNPHKLLLSPTYKKIHFMDEGERASAAVSKMEGWRRETAPPAATTKQPNREKRNRKEIKSVSCYECSRA